MQSFVVSQITTNPCAWTPLAYPTTTHHHATTKFRRLSPVSAVATQSLHPQVTQQMPPEKLEIFKSLEPWASQSVLPLLKPVEKSWQPTDFLPDPSQSSDGFIEEVRALQERTFGLPDEYFVVLAGNMISEDALPTYLIPLNTLDEVRDETGCSSTPWATWLRAWSAEENRHGDLLKTYLYLSGRVDMQMIERTVQYLICAGTDFGFEKNPFFGFVYTSFQERAVGLSHGNTARLAKEGGDFQLAKICGTIASDEKRHEMAYTRIVEKLLQVDPNETMLAIANMMRKKINMPAHLMYDGQDEHLVKHFSAVLQQLGIYTMADYADILEFFIGRWRLEKLEGLSGEGKHAQEFVCGLLPRIRNLQEKADEKARKLGARRLKFSWIRNKEVTF